MAWRDARPDWRRLLTFGIAIAVAMAALVAIHGLRDSLQRGIEKQARVLLGSDLQISSRTDFSPEQWHEVAQVAQAVSEETAFSTMIYFTGPGEGRLIQLRAISGDYPFFGEVVATPADAWRRMQRGEGVLLEPALLDQYGVKAGDTVRLGEVEVKILGSVVEPAPRSGRFAGIAPEVYTSHAVVAQSRLLEATRLVYYHWHVLLRDGVDLSAVFAAWERKGLSENWTLETPESRREQIGATLDRFQLFLSIVAMSALVLGAIGVASAVYQHVARRRRTVAMLRCLGVTSAAAMAIFLGQTVALGLVASLAGVLAGSVLHGLAVAWFGADLPVEIALVPGGGVVLRTAAAGFLVCCGFALLPLLGIRDIAPAVALRGEEQGAKRSRWLWRATPIFAVLFGALWLLAFWGGGDGRMALRLTGSLAAVFVLLGFTGWAVVLVTRWIVRPGWPYLLRQGIANLYRPRNQSVLFLLSLGLGVFLLLSILLARELVLGQIRVADSPDSPNIYLVDVQEDQVAGVKALLQRENLPALESSPMVTMRLSAVEGRPVSELRREGKVPDWVARREFRSSYRHHLNDTEKSLSGQWPPLDWTGAGPVPVSVEEGMAQDLGLELGSGLTFDIQGVRLQARVVHLREVDWSRFNLNFFMIFPEGVLEGAPGFHVVTTRLPDGISSGGLQREVARQFSNVSVIDLTLLLGTIRDILAKVSRAVEVLSVFTMFAGITILAGALLQGREQRLRESVLLRTLGASSTQVRIILLSEYATLGFLSALTGTLLALAGNVALAVFVFEVGPAWFPGMTLGMLFSAVLIAVITGSMIGRDLATHPPLEVLRKLG